ncbi:hypothetical protein AWQ21_09595 [Picosynechococcus sp. PCC 7003]|uniref:hypothetical protein n=1 Tax=Picosynechococcus sp. PCC 7003 TaxID=374981 RepID=UPI00081082BE|nr:hypothetical protein [Picosynechococcus sp. PCC 7003]ANV84615.1 hypothetical protein AWQ21_09595 [Picosynechococcus sp. PCC 7003]
MTCPQIATKEDIAALEGRLIESLHAKIEAEISALEARLVGTGQQVTLAEIKTVIEDSINLPYELEITTLQP